MTTNYKIILKGFALRTILLIFMAALFLQCDEFVHIDRPNSQLTKATVFNDRSTANVAVADLYAQMRENGFLSGNLIGLFHLAGIYSDEMVSYNTNSTAISSFYTNGLVASNSYVSSLWKSAYSQIYAANSICEGLEISPALLPDDKNQFKGEALFMRSVNHFYLLWLYGEVPYVTGTNYMENNRVMRMSKEELMTHIIADLEEALSLVGTAYIGIDRARANKAVVQAFLARVYLYNGQWQEASNMASAVLNETSVYQMPFTLDVAFLRTSSSTIWQLSAPYDGKNTYEGEFMIFDTSPSGAVSLRADLVQSFEAGDLRKANWVRTVVDGTNTWYHAFKYKEKTETESTLELGIAMRLSEQYLIRAEARLEFGDYNGAKEDLNLVRNAAGLGTTNANNYADLLTAILHERRVELFTEHGHRYFDLKRRELLNSALSLKPGWNTTDSLWPIPQNELLLNPLLSPQNPGY